MYNLTKHVIFSQRVFNESIHFLSLSRLPFDIRDFQTESHVFPLLIDVQSDMPIKVFVHAQSVIKTVTQMFQDSLKTLRV